MNQNQIGQRERKTQNPVIALLRKRLTYDYLGDLSDKNNTPVKADLLRVWLQKRGVPDKHIERAFLELEHAANDSSRTIYYHNRAVYGLLRYGVKFQPDLSENYHRHFASMRSARRSRPRAQARLPDA